MLSVVTGVTNLIETYPDFVVLEALCEGLPDSILVLLLYNTRCGIEDPEGRLALAGIVGDAQLEEDSKQFGPGLIYLQVSKLIAMFLGRVE